MTLDQLPEVMNASRLANEAHDIALAIKIDSPQMFQIAGDELRRITTRRKTIEELRLSLTRPIDLSKQRIMDLFRGPTERLSDAEIVLRSGMLTFERAEREKREAEQRKAESEARAQRERLEAERLAAIKAADLEKVEEIEHAIEVAEVAPVVAMVAPAPKAAGIGSRENWKHEVTNFRALVIAAGKAAEAGDDTLLAYLSPNDKAIGQIARALKAQTRIPGVRVTNDASLIVRSARA